MKTKIPLSLLLVSVLSVFSLIKAHGDGHGECQDGHGWGERNTNSGCIQGSETLEATVILVATSNAPAGVGGIARLESDNEDGTVVSDLKVTTQGLDAGDYTLGVV